MPAKETTDASKTVRRLEIMFHTLNEEYFGGEVVEPVVSICASIKPLSYITQEDTWVRLNGETKPEFRISANLLSQPIENVVATLLHAMVHQHNSQIHIKDTSRGMAYHNKRFRDTARVHGLDVEYDPRIGWGVTTPAERVTNTIVANGWDDFVLCQNENANLARPTSTRKVSCPCCGQSVGATKTVNIICGDCLVQMTEQFFHK